MKHLALIFVFLMAVPAWAVLPDEVLDDPVLEARARNLGQELRCVVCRGENIDESNAGIARDIRLLLRERLVVGDTDQQVLDFMVDRYGEYVLMRPTVKGANILLWIAAPAMLSMALIIAFFYLRRRAQGAAQPVAELSEQESRRLKELLNE